MLTRTGKLWLLFVTLVIFASCGPSNDGATKKIIFTGDLLLDRGVRLHIEHYGINSLFTPEVDQLFQSADMVVANLECPATKIEAPVNKQFIFRANPEGLEILKKHGITHLNMANNHSMDQGREGLTDTRNNILKSGLTPLGYGNNLKEACKAQLIETGPRNVYVLSSLQVPSENWTYLEDEPCVCEASFDNIALQIGQLKKDDAGCVVIVQLHWGAEHTLVPLNSQKQQAHQLIDAGADCIIGHHTHTIQTIEHYKGKPIYYSLGNFIFDQEKSINSKGLMVQMEVKADTIQFTNIPFEIKKCVPHIKEQPVNCLP